MRIAPVLPAQLIRMALGCTVAACFHSVAQAQAVMPEGTKGWWFSKPGISEGSWGYVGDPTTACTLTAKNHFDTPLVRIEKVDEATSPTYYCFYKHFWGGDIWAFAQTYFVCEIGYVATLPGTCVKRREVPRPLNCDPGKPGFGSNLPVVVASGAKFKRETDLDGLPSGAVSGFVKARKYGTGARF